MYQYNIKLNFKVERCEFCPFRHEQLINEGVESMDKLSGIVNILRKSSDCILTGQQIIHSEYVEGFNSKCPLKGNILYIPEDESNIKSK